MSANPASTALEQSAQKAEIPENISGIINALGFQPWQTIYKGSLKDLVNRLEKIEYFQVFFLSDLDNYDWTSHDPNPETVVNNVTTLQDLPGGQSEERRWFSECIMRWRHHITIEMDVLIRMHGENFIWFPKSRAHRDAFGYVLFLYMYLRSGKAPVVVSQLYADALSYVSNCVSGVAEEA